jgi:hypothetical protein
MLVIWNDIEPSSVCSGAVDDDDVAAAASVEALKSALESFDETAPPCIPYY